jgi:L-lactate dehydrogenase complex protein LldG
MSEAKQEILRKVRAALADIPAQESPADVEVNRSYLQTDSHSDSEHRIALFVERVSEYRAKVHRVAPSELSEAIVSACSRRNLRRLVVPSGVPDRWIPQGIETLRDDLLTNEQLNDSDGVLTGCALGIAQTGTIILDRGLNQGRRVLTLLPDYHLCVIFEEQVVGGVPEAVSRLKETAGTPGRPMTWIAGPSATSDIELNRVEGVHGPRTLEVLVVSGQVSAEEAGY